MDEVDEMDCHMCESIVDIMPCHHCNIFICWACRWTCRECNNVYCDYCTPTITEIPDESVIGGIRVERTCDICVGHTMEVDEPDEGDDDSNSDSDT
jgi:hypothetical protein